MKTINNFKKYSLYVLLLLSIFTVGCDDDDAPEEENEVEVFTHVTLIFTNTADDTDVVKARAVDPDGVGIEELKILDEITLSPGTSYKLTYEILNALDPNDPEDIGAEILDEDHEHQFFFSFTENAFTDPTGDGNFDGSASGDEAINYDDTDDEGNPVGLTTSWTTTATPLSDGMFTVQLQHQPGVKTSTSNINDGDTDFKLQFVLNIQ